MKIKNFIFPVVAIILFSIIYFIVIPFYMKASAPKKLYKTFESSLTDMGITYEKEESSAAEYGAKKAYSYKVDDKRIILYVFDKNSEVYEKGKEDGFIVSKENSESILYGFFKNNCVLFMESGFPNDEQILNLFSDITQQYIDTI